MGYSGQNVDYIIITFPNGLDPWLCWPYHLFVHRGGGSLLEGGGAAAWNAAQGFLEILAILWCLVPLVGNRIFNELDVLSCLVACTNQTGGGCSNVETILSVKHCGSIARYAPMLSRASI